MKTVCILDTETSGLDPSKDRLLEVGLVLYSLEHAAVIQAASLLVSQPTEDLDPASVDVHGIPFALLNSGLKTESVTKAVRQFASKADAFVAHHSDFDAQWLDATTRDALPWICTCNDLTWPKKGNSKSLTSVALAHGVGVVDAHRALSDCLTIARILTRVSEMGHDLATFLAPGLRPKCRVVSLAGFDDKDLVKANGFGWDPKGKVWWRKMALEDVASLPFQTRMARETEVLQ